MVQTPPVINKAANLPDTSNDTDHPPPMINLEEDNLPATQPVKNTRKRRGRTMSGGIPLSLIKKTKMMKTIDLEKPQITPTPTKKKNPTLADLQHSINCMNFTMKDTIAQSIATAMTEWRKECAADIKHIVEEAVSVKLQAVESSISAIQDKVNDIPNLAADVAKYEMEKRVGPIELKQLELEIELQDIKKREQEGHTQTPTVVDSKKQLDTLTDIVTQQQKYLEHLENSKRAKNLIIFGLPEKNMDVELPLNGEVITYHDDASKINSVLRSLGKPSAEIESIQRLGTIPNEDSNERNRPVLISLKTTSERNDILKVAKDLKTGPKEFRKIYLKKDVHPAVRREYNRLRQVEKEERGKPENEGKTVEYIKETREIKVDGIAVDSFQPQLF